jgi:hypothetical protein
MRNLEEYTVIKPTLYLKERVADTDLYTPILGEVTMSKEELAAHILKELTNRRLGNGTN